MSDARFFGESAALFYVQPGLADVQVSKRAAHRFKLRMEAEDVSNAIQS
jgi:hypothetical protein